MAENDPTPTMTGMSSRVVKASALGASWFGSGLGDVSSVLLAARFGETVHSLTSGTSKPYAKNRIEPSAGMGPATILYGLSPHFRSKGSLTGR